MWSDTQIHVCTARNVLDRVDAGLSVKMGDSRPKIGALIAQEPSLLNVDSIMHSALAKLNSRTAPPRVIQREATYKH